MAWRNRIIETRIVSAEELRANPLNWKQHGAGQRKVLEDILAKVGIVDSLLAYYSARAGGALTLINGHLRTEIGGEWPVKISDLSDEEADLLLAVLDPSVGLAEMDSVALGNLLASLEMVDNEEETPAALAVWLEEMQAGVEITEKTKLADASATKGRGRGNYGTTVKLVLVADDVMDVERAIAATENHNRAQAIMEVFRFYLEENAKGQHYIGVENLLTAQSTR